MYSEGKATDFKISGTQNMGVEAWGAKPLWREKPKVGQSR
jgi:hypothetical protein